MTKIEEKLIIRRHQTAREERLPWLFALHVRGWLFRLGGEVQGRYGQPACQSPRADALLCGVRSRCFVESPSPSRSVVTALLLRAV